MSEQKKLDDRAAFEAAFAKWQEFGVKGYGIWFKRVGDYYESSSVQSAWWGWQKARSLPVGVPDGYALVPVEPTSAMLLAAGGHITVDRYQAMLAAAPAAPAVKESLSVAPVIKELIVLAREFDDRSESAIAAYKSTGEQSAELIDQVVAAAARAKHLRQLADNLASTVKAEQVPADRAALVAELRKAAGEIASAGHFGWGNAMTAAAAALEAPFLPAAGSAVEPWHDQLQREFPNSEPEHWPASLTIPAMGREILELRAALSAQQSARQPELTVWEGSMPESNGKSNFTAVLMRKGADLFDGVAGGMTIASSEYPDRVRYQADCVRWLIGELDKEPCITDYDADKHSGYVDQQSAPELER